MKVFNVEVQKEKEVIFWLVDTRLSAQIAEHLYQQLDLGAEGGGTIFMVPSGAAGLFKPQGELEDVPADADGSPAPEKIGEQSTEE